MVTSQHILERRRVHFRRMEFLTSSPLEAQVVAAINSTPKDKRPSVVVSSTADGFYGNEIYIFMAQD